MSEAQKRLRFDLIPNLAQPFSNMPNMRLKHCAQYTDMCIKLLILSILIKKNRAMDSINMII